MSKQQESPQEFWTAVEQEIGEGIEIRCLAQVVDGSIGPPRESWSLFFVTAQAVYLRSVPTQGWQGRLKSLFGIGIGATSEEPETLRLPYNTVTEVEVDRPTSRWQRLLRPYPKERVVIRVGADWISIAPDGDAGEIAAAIAGNR